MCVAGHYSLQNVELSDTVPHFTACCKCTKRFIGMQICPYKQDSSLKHNICIWILHAHQK